MHTPRRWDFSWLAQAALIVLPVALLAGVSLHFLREDRATILEDARNQADSLMAQTIWQVGHADLSRASSLPHILRGEIVDGQGSPIPDSPSVPSPVSFPSPFDERWRVAQQAIYQRHDSAAAR